MYCALQLTWNIFVVEFIPKYNLRLVKLNVPSEVKSTVCTDWVILDIDLD